VFGLATRNFYLCVPCRDDMATFLPAVLRGGVDVVQLREKDFDHSAQRQMAKIMGPICQDFSVPFIMNDSPELAFEMGCDGVHVGQDDVSVEHCRQLLGDDAIVGLSTHSVDELAHSLPQRASYFSAGPIVPTPTKVGRPGTGVGYALEATARSDRPVFVTGGVDEHTVGDLVRAGLRHFVVVRALTQSPDPERTARLIRQAIDDALSAVSV
jgi:thiamine-phosphate pyrophosphorylase